MASKSTRRPFEDSDDESTEDSIATDTTDAGDLQEEYEVEKILAAMRDRETGQMCYLVKWAGYPLGDATWEPLTRDENASLLDEWQQQKVAIDEGRAKAFNIEDYEDAVGNLHAEKEEKSRRRQAKRDKRQSRAAARARPKVTRTVHDEDDDEGVEDAGRAVPRSVSGNETRTAKAAPQPQNASLPPKSVANEQASSTNRVNGQSHQESNRVAAASEPSSRKKSVSEQHSKPRPTSSSVGSGSQQATVGRLGTDIPRTKQTQKVSTAAGPKTLSTVHRAQKYAAREPPPDPEKLVTLDPKTGKPLGPGAPQLGTVAERIRQPTSRIDGDGRDTGPYHRRRSASPVRRASPPRLSSVTSASDRNLGQRGQSAVGPGGRPKTCRDWVKNQCHLSADACPYDHHWVDSSVMPTKAITCHFWRTRGACGYTSENCSYAHMDTGYYARPRGTDEDRMPDKPAQVRERQSVPKHELTCWYWLQEQGCSNHRCEFAHRDTGIHASQPGTWNKPSQAQERSFVPIYEQTCWFWLQSKCSNSNCEFAHRDTGIHAPPPKSRRKGVAPTIVALDGSRRDLGDPRTDSRQNDPGSATGGVPPLLTQKSLKDVPTGQVSPEQTSAPGERPPGHEHINRVTSQPASVDPNLPALDPALTIEASLQIHWAESDQPSVFPVCLEIIGPKAPASISLPSGSTLRVQHAVMTGDFQALVWNDRLTSTSAGGGFVRVASQHLEQAQLMVEYCKSTSSGLLARADEQCGQLLIYPADAEEWKSFAEHDQRGLQSDRALLRFLMFPEIRLTAGCDRSDEIAKDALAEPPNVLIGVEILALAAGRMIQREDGKRKEAVFLIFPATRNLELQLYSNLFLHLGCKVYHSGLPGAWTYFCKRHGKSCLVMIHPDIQLERIPGLHDFLAQYGNGAQIFSIGVDRLSAAIHDEPPSFECTRLFPYGQAYLLTDVVLLEHPEAAAEIVQLMTQYRLRPLSHSKIVTRPQVKQWLLDQSAERQDTRLLPLYSAICLLCPLEDEDPNEPGQPLATSGLVTVEATALPKLAQLDTDACSDYLVNWFAGWAVEHASVWRTFIVCHAPPQGGSRMVLGADGRMELTDDDGDPQGWRRKYNHIGLRTPQQLVDELRAKK